MSVIFHELHGCTPEPLAQYLKALGILRLVVTQGADLSARGCWRNERFCLLTKLSRDELEQFFLQRYQPTPLLSPWNGGSGFFRDGDPGLAPLEGSTAARFERMREGIRAARELLDQQSHAYAVIGAIKARTKTNKAYQSDEQRELLRTSAVYQACLGEARGQEAVTLTLEGMVTGAPPPTRPESDELKSSDGYKRLLAAAERRYKALKDDLLPTCRKRWRAGLAEWMAAAAALDGDGTAIWPSLLGTGGNDGRLDFTNNYMQRLNELFAVNTDGAPAPDAGELLANALWGAPTNRMGKTAVGQFQPGGAGGANSSTGAMGESLVNPWDFVLMMEGTVLFRVQATRRLDPNAFGRAAAPFAVRSHPVGYGSSGEEKAQRGEQWLPLWEQPATFGEVAALFGEARIQLGKQTAGRPVEVARAISRLGVARGVRTFVRYGYLERNGQSTLAVPLGRMDVHEVAHARLIDDLAAWMDRLQRLARDKNAPSRLVHAERRLADAVMAALMHDPTPERWQEVLLAAVAVEHLQATGCAIAAGPIPPLQAEWVQAAGDLPEVRLALSLASVKRPDPVRHHWLPLEPGARSFKVSDKRLMNDPRVVMMGRDALADCAALVERRIIEAAADSKRCLPLEAAAGYGARLSDIARFLHRDKNIDPERVLGLARAFMALRTFPPASQTAGDGEKPPDVWLALRLAFLPWRLPPLPQIPAEVATLRRLLAGDTAGAVAAALSRLRIAGIRPPLQVGMIDQQSARLWAAALAFPISKKTAIAAAITLDPNQKGILHV